jgi:hypothetical protein
LSGRVRSVRWLAILCSVPLACGQNVAAEAPAAPEAPPLHRGPLSDYVPAAGLRWMLLGSPKRIAENPAFVDSVKLLFPEPRLSTFTRGSGVDLTRVDSALIAGFDFGTLYALEPPPGATAAILSRFRERLLTSERAQRPHPQIERIAGVIGTTPEMLVRIEERLVAVAVGDPTPARVVEAFARKRLHKSPRALEGASLSTLEVAPPNAVATFYAPGPFSGEWARGAHGLLADSVALRISMMPVSRGRARFQLELSGEFAQDAGDRMLAAFRDLQTSSLGTLLALDQSDAPPKIEQRADRLRVEIELDLRPVSEGLRAAVMADVWEILDLRPPD